MTTKPLTNSTPPRPDRNLIETVRNLMTKASEDMERYRPDDGEEPSDAYHAAVVGYNNHRAWLAGATR